MSKSVIVISWSKIPGILVLDFTNDGLDVNINQGGCHLLLDHYVLR